MHMRAERGTPAQVRGFQIGAYRATRGFLIHPPPPTTYLSGVIFLPLGGAACLCVVALICGRVAPFFGLFPWRGLLVSGCRRTFIYIEASLEADTQPQPGEAGGPVAL